MSESTMPDLPLEEEGAEVLPPLSADQIRQIVEGNLALRADLERDPTVMAEIEAVIRDHTRKEITPSTVSTIYGGLQLYLSDEGAGHLLTVLVNAEDPRYREQTQAHADPQTWTWLRRLLALYGSDVQEANFISGENPDTWRELNRQAYYDAVSGAWGIRIEIIKFSDERLLLDGHVGAAFALALGILDTLSSIPPEVAPDLVDRDSVKAFLHQCYTVSERYAPGVVDELSEPETESNEEW